MNRKQEENLFVQKLTVNEIRAIQLAISLTRQKGEEILPNKPIMLNVMDYVEYYGMSKNSGYQGIRTVAKRLNHKSKLVWPHN